MLNGAQGIRESLVARRKSSCHLFPKMNALIPCYARVSGLEGPQLILSDRINAADGIQWSYCKNRCENHRAGHEEDNPA